MTFQSDTCAVCGSPMSESLVRLGSIRCHDCRETAAPLLSRSVEAHAVGTLVAHTEREDSLTATQTQTDTAREFAHRAGDGLDVTLVWYPDSEPVAVRVTDARSGDTFELRVDPRGPRSTPSSTRSPTPPTPRASAGPHSGPRRCCSPPTGAGCLAPAPSTA